MLRPSDLDLLDNDTDEEEEGSDEEKSVLPKDDYSDEEPEPHDNLPNENVPWSETLMQAHGAGTRMSTNMLALLPTLTHDRAEMQALYDASKDETERVELRDIIGEIDDAIGKAQHGKPQTPAWGQQAP